MDVKTIPHSIDAEQNVLGAVFLDPESVRIISDKLENKDFYSRRHRLIYGAILDLFQDNIDIDYTTLISHLETRNLLLDAGGTDYILGLSETTPSIANLEHYINIVRDKSVIRSMIETAKDISEKGYLAGDMADYIDEAERRIFDVAKSRRTSDFVTLKAVTEDVIRKTEAAKNITGSVTGLDTGFRDLNLLTLGLQREELYIIAARPSMGKSAFALNIATNVARHSSRPTVAFFSLEMGVDQLVSRMLSSESNVDSTSIRIGKLTPPQWQQISVASNTLSQMNILFDDSGTVKVTDLRQKCRKLAQENRLDLVVVDYLQLLSGSISHGGNRVQEVSEISRTLKEMARELKIPVIALSQLSRNVENRQDKKPIMADLRESGSIEQDADVIIFLYRDDYYNEHSERPNQVDVIIAKNRSGSINTQGIPMIFKKQYSLFKSKTHAYQPADSISEDDMPDI